MIQFDKHVIQFGCLNHQSGQMLVGFVGILQSDQGRDGKYLQTPLWPSMYVYWRQSSPHGFSGWNGERYALMLGRDLGNLSFFDYKKQMVKGWNHFGSKGGKILYAYVYDCPLVQQV